MIANIDAKLGSAEASESKGAWGAKTTKRNWV
jgi:hypothetical protein